MADVGGGMANLLRVLNGLSDKAEAMAVFEALAQYVENERCRDDVEDAYEANPLLKHAEAVLDRLNGEIAILAQARAE